MSTFQRRVVQIVCVVLALVTFGSYGYPTDPDGRTWLDDDMNPLLGWVLPIALIGAAAFLHQPSRGPSRLGRFVAVVRLVGLGYALVDMSRPLFPVLLWLYCVGWFLFMMASIVRYDGEPLSPWLLRWLLVNVVGPAALLLMMWLAVKWYTRPVKMDPFLEEAYKKSMDGQEEGD